MKKIKVALTILAFVGALSSAFATKPMSNRNLYTNSSGPCHILFCRTNNIENMGTCQNTHIKYSNSICTIVYEGQTWQVTLP